MKISNRKAFTLIEMLIVAVIISSWIIWIVSVLDYWIKYIWKIRQDVIAINLAREWIEWVFNIRDTNWLRWSWRKDQCWIISDPLWDETADCATQDWIVPWNYIIDSKLSDRDQYYFFLSWVSETLDIENWISSDDRVFALCQDDLNNSWYTCPWEENTWPEWRFFRMITVHWLFDKHNDVEMNCDRWTSAWCWLNDAKELRFCSIVEYFWHWYWKVELCSSFTNFRD